MLFLSSLTIVNIITIFIFIFSLHHTTALPSHSTLSGCHNTTFNCGSLTNVSYPFTGGDRPSFCGPPEFQLSCGDGFPELNISLVSYRVLQLDSAAHTLTLARLDLWNETCTHEYVNSTFEDTSFSYGSGNQNLTLFYGCTPSVALNVTPENLFHCESNGNKSDSYSVLGPYSLDPVLSIVGCDVSVEVPILEEEANRLVDNRSLLREVLMNGFHVNYSNRYETECFNCRGSGGQCGFDSDKNEPICSCGDQLCPSTGSSFMRDWRLKAAIGASTGGAGVIVVIIAMIIYNRKRSNLAKIRITKKTRTIVDHNVEDFIKSYGSLAPRKYSYSEVKRITNSFTDKLGEGGYGVVYKASLPDGCHVAVKIISESKGSGEEFINEVVSISRTSHVNIVSLLGFCLERNKRALIYEFMSNGSLDKFIYKRGYPNAICNLNWNTLHQIAIGIARGLEYLHRGCNTRILHLDIKPQNILLDEDFCPKISDFGLAKMCQKKESIVSMVGTRGTIGYIAPEVFSRTFGGVSHKSDVYSYGMLIFEMVGGRKNHNSGVSHSSEMYFPDYIYRDLEQGNVPTSCLLITEEENELVKKMTLVSLWCIQTNPSNRPSMSKVVEMLEGPLHSVPFPPKPFLYSLERSPLQILDASSSNLNETNSILKQEYGSIE